jgi:hypothetical protein
MEVNILLVGVIAGLILAMTTLGRSRVELFVGETPEIRGSGCLFVLIALAALFLLLIISQASA